MSEESALHRESRVFRGTVLLNYRKIKKICAETSKSTVIIVFWAVH
jgi:hypothetical protein